ncbi:TlpA disulfide reductase family protein [Sideroxyarcus emersonii]|nr:TlpA disulfide reductase family protein [Sideroxyarcus emersonii]
MMMPPRMERSFLPPAPISWAGALLALLLCSAPAVRAGAWDLKDTAGVHHTLAAEKGKWVLVNFWAPWCPPCLQEMPELEALQQQRKDVQVIGVAVLYRKRQEVLEAVRSTAVSYPVVLGNEDIASDFGEMHGMPTSFLYDPSGKLVGKHDGPVTREEVEEILDSKVSPGGGRF